jgi:hypothetical protein
MREKGWLGWCCRGERDDSLLFLIRGEAEAVFVLVLLFFFAIFAIFSIFIFFGLREETGRTAIKQPAE